MGPNGSGKTTLAYALMGHPAYQVTGGKIIWKGRDILALTPDKRARLGIVPGLPVPDGDPRPLGGVVHPSALNAKLQGIDKDADIDPTDPVRGGVSMREFRAKMREKMALLRMDESFASRYVNEGFSGGEKKRLEMLQMAVIEPEMAILDETDSASTSTLSGSWPRASTRCSTRTSASSDHPLPAVAQPHQARRRPRPGAGPHRQERRP